MRRYKVYTRNVGERYWWEAARFWTRSGAERWAMSNRRNLRDYFKVSTKR